MMKFYPVSLLFIVIAALFVTSCSNLTPADQRASVIESEKNTVTIGVVWPFETANNLFLEGVELAVAEINESGGVLDRQLRIEKLDDEANVTKGLEKAQEFVENDHIVAVIGHRNSYVSIPASSIYEKAGIVM